MTPLGCCDEQPPIGSDPSPLEETTGVVNQITALIARLQAAEARIARLESEVDTLQNSALGCVSVDFDTQTVTQKTVTGETIS